MKTIWYIAKKDLLQALKDRNSLILLLVVPLILIAVVGAAFGSFTGNSSSTINIAIAVSNQDSGYVGKTVTDALRINTSQLVITTKQESNTSQVINDVSRNDSNAVSAGVVIPSGTTDALLQAAQNGTSTSNLIKFYTLPNNNSTEITIVQNLVTSVMNQLVIAQYASNAAVKQVYSVCNQPGNHCAQSTIAPATIAQIVSSSMQNATRSPQVQMLTAGQTLKISTFNQVLPGYAIFFALFSINAAAATILQEKEDGTFRRLLIAPVQKYALLGGKLLAQFLLTLAQLTVLFGVGYFLFHLTITSWPAVILLLIGASFAATGLGILLVSVVKTRRQLAPVVTLVTLITSAIGGAWWPLFIEPTWMQQVAKIGLTAWAMEGLNNIMIYNRGFLSAMPSMLGLLGYGLLCFLIALRFFRFQEKGA